MGYGMRDTISRIQDYTSGPTRGVQGQDSLDSDVHGGSVKLLQLVQLLRLEQLLQLVQLLLLEQGLRLEQLLRQEQLLRLEQVPAHDQ